MKKKCIVTIIESLSVTSMPLNEFVLFRHKHHYPIKQILIVCSHRNPSGIRIPSEIDTYYVGRSLIKMRAVLVSILMTDGISNYSFVFHLHSQRPALLFFLATMGLNVRKKTLFTVHNTYRDRNYKYKITSFLCSLMSKEVTCVSQAAYDRYSSIIKYIKKEHIRAIPNGVDFSRIHNTITSIQSHSVYMDTKCLVCVARLIRIKNQQFLIRLLPLLPQYKLFLIGEGILSDELKQLANSLGVSDRVVFTGLLFRDEVFKLMNTCSIYVSSSHVEGLPISVLESMSIGLYPILSDIPSHQEIAKVCDITVLPLVTELWVNAINNFDSLSLFDKQNVSKGLVDKTKECFSLETMHKAYDKVYQQIIGAC